MKLKPGRKNNSPKRDGYSEHCQGNNMLYGTARFGSEVREKPLPVCIATIVCDAVRYLAEGKFMAFDQEMDRADIRMKRLGKETWRENRDCKII